MNNFDQPELPYPEEHVKKDTANADEIEGDEIKSGEEVSNDSITTINPTPFDFPENPEKEDAINLITKSGKIIESDIVKGLQEAINLLIKRRRSTDFTKETLELALRELFGKNEIGEEYYHGESVWETTLPDIRFVEKNTDNKTYHLLEKEYKEFVDYYSSHRLPREKGEPIQGSVEIKPEDRGLYLFLQKIIKESGRMYYDPNDRVNNFNNGKYTISEYVYISRILKTLNLDQVKQKWVGREIILSGLKKEILTENTNSKGHKTYFLEENDPSVDDEEDNIVEIQKFIDTWLEYLKKERTNKLNSE